MGTTKTGVAAVASDASKRSASPASTVRRTKQSSATPSSTGKNLTLSSLPPDLIIRIFTFLPVPDLPRVAGCSRRLKILVYNDDVFEHKLRVMGMLDAGTGPVGVDEAEIAAVNKLSSRLKQLPGGNMLPGGTKYLESGTMWDGTSPVSVEPPEEATPSTGDQLFASGSAESNTSGGQGDLLGLDITKAGGDETTAAAPAPEGSPAQRITAALPQIKKSAITIGSGGLQAAGKSASATSIGAKRNIDPYKVNVLKSLNGVRPRDAFRSMYSELAPYYLDFRTKQKDSKVFRDFKDLIEVGSMLRRIRRFSQAKFILDMDEVNFSLETTIEWFESMVLSQFERAYDTKNMAEMRRNALACFELNGGAAVINLFISKNPIFYDQTFNPSLIPSLTIARPASPVKQAAPAGKTPAAEPEPTPSAPLLQSTGYALADDFAKFMDQLLTSCKEQAVIVGRVFEPEMDAMTAFVNKVFEDSIAEYLQAVLTTARERETSGIYLHTLATAVHCCTQFLEFIAAAEPGVRVETVKVTQSIITLFKPYTDKYIDLEVKHLGKRFDAELKRWNNRKETKAKAKTTDGKAAYLGDAEKAQAHKRQVMSVMKTVLYAPMALGKTLAIMGNGLIGGGQGEKKSQSTDDLGEELEEAATYHLDDDSMGSLVSLELCLKLLHANKESLGRTLVITSAVDNSKLRNNVGKIFIKLLEAIGEKHMRPAFESAIARLGKSTPIPKWSESGEKSVNMDSLQFFELVHISDLIHQMVDMYYAEDVRPWVDENDFLSDIMVEKKSFDRSSDDNVASGMDKSIQVLINQVDHIMNEMHLMSDYNPPANTNAVFDLKPTKACATVIACLQAHVRLLQGSTHKDTLEVFLGEVGVRLFNVICKNLKKWQVSPTGAMQLICDLNRYNEWACSLRVPSVSRLFVVLKELGNLYLAEGGNELRNMVHDAELYQGLLRPEEIYELLAARTDYKKIQKFVESKDCLIM
ncbi:F-box protein: endocytic membrane traffic, recycling ReCYcling 1 [Phlyctochytrium bullatum]|nr:F-box protein: endocytic membrane traffic, recycling ReCYcling 1 [Phlyctochytrium bullatum]